MMIADTGDIEKVRGRRMATPLAPPRPGSTPISTPRKMPTNMWTMFIGSARTPKPWISDERASKNFSGTAVVRRCPWASAASVTERGLERSLRQGHEEPHLEHEEERDRDQDR